MIQINQKAARSLVETLLISYEYYESLGRLTHDELIQRSHIRAQLISLGMNIEVDEIYNKYHSSEPE